MTRPVLLSARQVAERCWVDPRTVMRWRDYEDFPATTLSDPIFGAKEMQYDWEAVKQW